MSQEATKQKQLHVPPQLAQLLLKGDVTLAQVTGLDRRKLYEIANVAFQMLNSGKLEEAKTIYRGLVAADPNDSVFHCHLAATQHRMGEIDEALAGYEQALALNHTNIDSLVGRGEILYMRGEFTTALTDLRRAIELDPRGQRPSTQRARALVLALKEALEKQEALAQSEAAPPVAE
jgi:tetratricopeptide (TPR) repeat protein